MKLKEKFDKLLKQFNKLRKSFLELEKLMTPKWFNSIRLSNEQIRQEAFQLALEGISTYHKGEVTPQGKTLVKSIMNDYDFIGFTPNVMYCRGHGKEMNTLFIHPWGQRTLLLKHKEMPILMIVNSSIKLNESALGFIKGNESFSDLFDLEGLTG